MAGIAAGQPTRGGVLCLGGKFFTLCRSLWCEHSSDCLGVAASVEETAKTFFAWLHYSVASPMSLHLVPFSQLSWLWDRRTRLAAEVMSTASAMA